MLCAGLTVYSPLVRNGCGPGKKVGIVGVGGLVCIVPLRNRKLLLTSLQGHYAVLFAKALGAEVYVFSHSPDKQEDVKKMGADHYILTEEGFEKNHQMTLDLIVSTCNNVKGLHLKEYLS
jgi:D-arabinose 1-dehydrogenase-like Zn-dependent alcohol dehydrogenase